MPAAAGSFVTTANDVELSRTRGLAANTTAFVLTGFPAALVRFVIVERPGLAQVSDRFRWITVLSDVLGAAARLSDRLVSTEDGGDRATAAVRLTDKLKWGIKLEDDD